MEFNSIESNTHRRLGGITVVTDGFRDMVPWTVQSVGDQRTEQAWSGPRGCANSTRQESPKH